MRRQRARDLRCTDVAGDMGSEQLGLESQIAVGLRQRIRGVVADKEQVRVALTRTNSNGASVMEKR